MGRHPVRDIKGRRPRRSSAGGASVGVLGPGAAAVVQTLESEGSVAEAYGAERDAIDAVERSRVEAMVLCSPSESRVVRFAAAAGAAARPVGIVAFGALAGRGGTGIGRPTAPLPAAVEPAAPGGAPGALAAAVVRAVERARARRDAEAPAAAAEAAARDAAGGLRLDEVLHAKRELEAVFDAITDPVTIVDERHHLVRANRAAAALAGIDVRTMPGRTCHEALLGRGTPCEGCPVRAMAVGDGGPTDRPPLETRDERGDRRFMMTAYPCGRDGPPGGPAPVRRTVACAYRDVTGERLLERRLVQSAKMAAVGTLAGGVAHEINNPLGGMLAMAQVMLRGMAEDDPRRSDVVDIEQGAVRCKRVVESLLNFSRERREGAAPRPVALRDVVEQALRITRFRLKGLPIAVSRDDADGAPYALCDANEAAQVVVNLVLNAVDAMPDGGSIAVRTFRAPDGRAGLAVADTGTGIAAEHLARIFEPFFTTKDEGKGTGLGLAISYRIVERYGGTFDVQSRLGHGTTFTVTLPAADAGAIAAR